MQKRAASVMGTIVKRLRSCEVPRTQRDQAAEARGAALPIFLLILNVYKI